MSSPFGVFGLSSVRRRGDDELIGRGTSENRFRLTSVLLANHLARGGFAMRPLHAVVMGAIGLTMAAAGCGGAIPGSNGGPAALGLQGSSHGRVLVDGQGHALYLFEKDEHGESYCDGACAAVWPPLETSATPRGTAGLDGGSLGTIRRDDGGMQVTFHGHPLYYYAGDASTPGKSNGQEVEQFGDEWYLVDARGKPVESEAASRPKSKSNSGTTGGGGGY
jgi:predicted lipoprotein with Yx(FWY)xxD motif